MELEVPSVPQAHRSNKSVKLCFATNGFGQICYPISFRGSDADAMSRSLPAPEMTVVRM